MLTVYHLLIDGVVNTADIKISWTVSVFFAIAVPSLHLQGYWASPPSPIAGDNYSA